MGPVLFLALAQRLAAVTGQGPGLVHVGSQGVAKWPGCHRPSAVSRAGSNPDTWPDYDCLPSLR